VQTVPLLAGPLEFGQWQDTASRFLVQCQHTDWIELCWTILGGATGIPPIPLWFRAEVASHPPQVTSARF
jgi:hypothetical protein